MGIKKKSAELCDSVDEIQQERQRCGPAAAVSELRRVSLLTDLGLTYQSKRCNKKCCASPY